MVVPAVVMTSAAGEERRQCRRTSSALLVALVLLLPTRAAESSPPSAAAAFAFDSRTTLRATGRLRRRRRTESPKPALSAAESGGDGDGDGMDRALESISSMKPFEWSDADFDPVLSPEPGARLSDLLAPDDEEYALYQSVLREMESDKEASEVGREEMDASADLWSSGVGSAVVMAGGADRHVGDFNSNSDLLPAVNPHAHPKTASLAGVPYAAVLRGLNVLFPPSDLERRNAVSRADGYWSYVGRGLDPPRHLTYGEFDLHFFAELLDRARYSYQGDDDHENEPVLAEAEVSCLPPAQSWEGLTFADIGSGAGRLVLAAAALHPFRLCRGLEVLPGVHRLATENLERCRVFDDRGCVSEGIDVDVDYGDEDDSDSGGAAMSGVKDLSRGVTEFKSDDEWLRGLTGKLFRPEDGKADDVAEDGNDEDEWRSVDDCGNRFADSALASAAVDKEMGKYSDREWKNPSHCGSLGGSAISADNEEEEENEEEWRSPDDFGSVLSIPSTAWGSNQDILSKTALEDESSSVDNDKDVVGDENKAKFALHCPPLSFADPDMDTYSDVVSLPLAPIHFECGSFMDPYQYLGDIDVAFVFSSCMEPDLLADLSRAIGRQFKPGGIVITTEFPLPLEGTIEPLEEDPSMPHGPYRFELLEKVEGWCWLTGGESTAFVHRVAESLWEEDKNEEGRSGMGKRREQPRPTAERSANDVVKAMDAGTLTDTTEFLRRVRNEMAFNGLAKDLWPDI